MEGYDNAGGGGPIPEAAPYKVGGTGLRHVHLPCALRARGPARGPPLYCESESLSLTRQKMKMMIAMKPMTPPTMPKTKASMLYGPVAVPPVLVGRGCLGLGFEVVRPPCSSVADEVMMSG